MCQLVHLDVAAWHGLPTIPIGAPPTCVGTRLEAVESDPGSGFLERTTFQASNARVDLIGSGTAELVDVIPDQPPAGAAVLAPLGTSDARARYDAELRRRRPIGEPGEEVDEVIFARRGLAVLIDARGRLLRVRGFAPMAVERYRALYGRYRPVQFAPD